MFVYMSQKLIMTKRAPRRSKRLQLKRLGPQVLLVPELLERILFPPSAPKLTLWNALWFDHRIVCKLWRDVIDRNMHCRVCKELLDSCTLCDEFNLCACERAERTYWLSTSRGGWSGRYTLCLNCLLEEVRECISCGSRFLYVTSDVCPQCQQRGIKEKHILYQRLNNSLFDDVEEMRRASLTPPEER